MFNRKIRARSAAAVLVALQSVAFFGHAQAHDVDEYVEVFADPSMVRGAEISQEIRPEIEAIISDLNVERSARLGERICLSTRELLAAAAPVEDAVTKPMQASVRDQPSKYPRAGENLAALMSIN